MSHGIHVGDVLNESFQFGLQRWGTVVRLAWAPVLVSLLLLGGFVGLVFDVGEIAQMDGAEPTLSASELLRVPVFAAVAFGAVLYVAIGLLYSGAMASIFRLVALGEDEGRFINIRLNGPAWRVFWASLIIGVMTMGIWLAAFGIALPLTGKSFGAYFADLGSLFSAILAAAQTGSDEIAASQATAMFGYWKSFLYAVLIALVPVVYLNVRLAPFIAGSAAENRLILLGSFDLTRGRFWPLFGAMFLVGLLLAIIGVVFELVSSVIELLMGLGDAGGALAIIAGLLGIAYFALIIFYYAVVYGVQLSFHAIIYRRLKTGA